MPEERPLRAVLADEKPPAKVEQPKTVVAAADAGERQLLVAMRTHLARELDAGKVPAHALAGVTKTIRDYDREIRAIDARAELEQEQKREREADQGASNSSDEAWTAV